MWRCSGDVGNHLFPDMVTDQPDGPVHAIFGGVPRPTPRGVLNSSPYAYLEAVSLVLAGSGKDRITIPQRFLLSPHSTDHLLALAGFHNCTGVHRPFGNFMKLFREKAHISEDGMTLSGSDIQLAAALQYSAEQVLSVINTNKFMGFKIPSAL